MFVRQISIYIENIRGSLRELTQLLGENDIDLKALSIADTSSFGIVRCIVEESQIDKTIDLLRENGHIAKVNNVICVCVPDKPLGLSSILTLLEQAGISIEYIYSFYKSTGALLDSVQQYLLFYNRQRPHSRLGYRTPEEMEQLYKTKQAASTLTDRLLPADNL